MRSRSVGGYELHCEGETWRNVRVRGLYEGVPVRARQGRRLGEHGQFREHC